jgi:SAM-dependent methyltransferase
MGSFLHRPRAFHVIAPYYDELMQDVPYDRWVQYYLQLLREQGISPKKLLDVCCGTGTMAEKLYRKGYQVVGIDLSEAMIDRAFSKATKNREEIEYKVADASHFALGQKFDAAYSFFDSLNYILDPQSLRKAFACVAAHLYPGGSFIFDLNTAYAFESGLFNQEDFHPRAKVKYRWRGSYDPATRIVEVEMDFWLGNRRLVEIHKERAHSFHEVREFLAQAGFCDIRAYNSYTLKPPHKKSDRVHWAAVLGS